ncbi:hypothetical protein E6H33_09100 [Candidatus Bathyarchaeota archaeon]|nr:MAG: hypothetical protein E6H33_09100 [Candidatus Bathyarchaeota archaeon]
MNLDKPKALSRRRWRVVALIAVSAMLALTPLTATHFLTLAHALPTRNRTIGLRADAAGWHDLPTSTNPTISIYDDTNVTAFLNSGDGAAHQLVIFTPTLIQSPVFSGTPTIKFSFTLDTAGVYGYCDQNTGQCGTLRVNVIGDVNGDFVVNSADGNIISQYYSSKLNSSWNPQDKPYLDGRVDFTDLLIVGYFFGVPPPWPTPYNPDVNGDGKVDISDLSAVSAHLGNTAPAPFNNPNQGPDINYDNTIDILDASAYAAHNGCTITTCR